MNIVIAGGSGFIGTKLTEHLLTLGHTVYILTRNPTNKPVKKNVYYVEWLQEQSAPERELEGIHVFINLAGESIGAKRWTKIRKTAILESRLETTRAVVRLLTKLKQKPDVLINASAIGYYGHSKNETFTEKSAPIAADFLAGVVQKWEKEAAYAANLGIRVVFFRLGVVLDKEAGALKQMILPYHLFAGGTVGSGDQWLSWIHIDDVIRMIPFIMDQKQIVGPFNATAPNPVRMKEFGQIAGKVLNRPHWLPAPSLAIKLLLGEMSELVLKGQYVYPEQATSFQYPFLYRSLQPALENLFN